MKKLFKALLVTGLCVAFFMGGFLYHAFYGGNQKTAQILNRLSSIASFAKEAQAVNCDSCRQSSPCISTVFDMCNSGCTTGYAAQPTVETKKACKAGCYTFRWLLPQGS